MHIGPDISRASFAIYFQDSKNTMVVRILCRLIPVDTATDDFSAALATVCAIDTRCA